MSTQCSETHLYFVIFGLTYLSGWEGVTLPSVTLQVIFTVLSKPLNHDTNLIIMDGKQILCRLPIYIPSFVYSGK